MTPTRFSRFVAGFVLSFWLVAATACQVSKPVLIAPTLPVISGDPSVGATVTPPTVLDTSRAWVQAQITAGKISPTLTDPNCMIPALPAVSTTGSNDWAMTLVHPQIIEFSMHHRPGVGWTIMFGGEAYTITKLAWNDAGPDIAFGLLDRPVPDTVKPMRSILALDVSLLKLPVFWYTPTYRNKMQLLEVVSFNINSTAFYGKAISTTTSATPGWRIGTDLISGDSGSPLVARIDGEWVVLCTAYSARIGSGIHNYYQWTRDLWKASFNIDAPYQTITLKTADANDDGKVDFADFVTLSNHFGLKTDQGHNVGDFNRDGVVDFADFVILSQNYGK